MTLKKIKATEGTWMRWRAQRASFLTCWGEITCASQNVDRLPGVPLARQGGWGAVPSTDTNTRVLWVPSAKGLLCGDPTKGPGCRLCTWRSAHCFLSRDGHSLPAELAQWQEGKSTLQHPRVCPPATPLALSVLLERKGLSKAFPSQPTSFPWDVAP